MKKIKAAAGFLMFVSVNASSMFGYGNRVAIEITHLTCTMGLFLILVFLADSVQQKEIKSS